MSTLLARLPALAATGVGSLPFDDPEPAAAHACRAYSLPFCPQLPALDGDMISEWLGSDPRRCGWSTDRDRERPAAWDAVMRRLRAAPPAHRLVKLQATGPVTLATALAHGAGRPAGHDDVAALAGEIATWLAANVADQVRRLTELGLDALLVVDEPALARSPVGGDDAALWDPLRAAAPAWGLHVCGVVPWELVARLEPDVLSFDVGRSMARDALPALRTIVRRGGRIAWGVLDPTDTADVTAATQLAAGAIARLVRPGLSFDDATRRSMLTPTGGTGALTPAAEHLIAASLAVTAQRTAESFALMTRARSRLVAE